MRRPPFCRRWSVAAACVAAVSDAAVPHPPCTVCDPQSTTSPSPPPDSCRPCGKRSPAPIVWPVQHDAGWDRLPARGTEGGRGRADASVTNVSGRMLSRRFAASNAADAAGRSLRRLPISAGVLEAERPANQTAAGGRARGVGDATAARRLTRHRRAAANDTDAADRSSFHASLSVNATPEASPHLPIRHGVCSSEVGWRPRLPSGGSLGVNCTFYGRRAWPSAPAAVMIGGCARGISDDKWAHSVAHVDALIASLSPAGGALVFDDNAADGRQRRLLTAWAARSRFVRLMFAEEDLGERVLRLALCRNVILHEALAHMHDLATLLLLDLDCAFPRPDDTLRFLRPDAATADFDVLTANNLGAYRDLWALRAPALGMDYDCFWDFKRMRADGNCKKYKIHIHPSAPAFGLTAGFNGAASHRIGPLRRALAQAACRYDNVTRAGSHIVSEHVPLQLCLSAHGVRLGIAPWYTVKCASIALRHDARRLYMLPNGTLVSVGFGRKSEAAFRTEMKRLHGLTFPDR